ncbi:MAG: 5'-3' exonuclease H3TH domain-containing protein [Acidimicrobiia bacterium]
MIVHLIDGTYELFRHFFGAPPRQDSNGREVGAVVGAVRSLFDLVAPGAHIGIATDHVIESFRNDMYPGYKTGDGIDPVLLAQFPIFEAALEACGFALWPMTKYEADDALASAAALAVETGATEVRIYTPDKDLSQCVGGVVVQVDRRKRETIDTEAVQAKFGVLPESIPDYLGLVGDSADGFPGLPGWGAKSAGVVLAAYHHLENIPADADAWTIQVRGATKLAATLQAQFEDAVLFRDLATLRTDAPVGQPEDWVWNPSRPSVEAWAESAGVNGVLTKVRWT